MGGMGGSVRPCALELPLQLGQIRLGGILGLPALAGGGPDRLEQAFSVRVMALACLGVLPRFRARAGLPRPWPSARPRRRRPHRTRFCARRWYGDNKQVERDWPHQAVLDPHIDQALHRPDHGGQHGTDHHRHGLLAVRLVLDHGLAHDGRQRIQGERPLFVRQRIRLAPGSVDTRRYCRGQCCGKGLLAPSLRAAGRRGPSPREHRPERRRSARDAHRPQREPRDLRRIPGRARRRRARSRCVRRGRPVSAVRRPCAVHGRDDHAGTSAAAASAAFSPSTTSTGTSGAPQPRQAVERPVVAPAFPVPAEARASGRSAAAGTPCRREASEPADVALGAPSAPK